MDTRKRKLRLNISQFSKRTGFSADKIDLLIQEGVISRPESFTFSQNYVDQLIMMRHLSRLGMSINCNRRCECLVHRF